MIAGLEEVLVPTPAGLYCPAGDFHVDPMGKVARAVITHGHADHARAGHGAVLATAETLGVMAVRYGQRFAATRQALAYGEAITIGAARVRLAPAGHILGSAQVVIETRGLRAVVSGDYKRRADPTCPAFEPVPCDLFVTEATFAVPVYRHPPAEAEVARLLHSLALFPTRAHFIGVYSLGKAQRLIALLRRAGHDAPIHIHRSLEGLCALYETFGVPLGRLEPLGAAPPQGLGGAIILGPPGLMADPWLAGLADPVRAFASGWMRLRHRARAQGVELPLIVSDHADWDELVETLDEVRPGAVWITHGPPEALMRAAEMIGVSARPLRLAGYGDEGGEGPGP